MDTRTRRDGREIEELGIYDPMVEETDARAILNGERIDYWLSVGAQPSPKAGTLIKKYGTDGTHLDAQKEALERIGGRRAASISAAVQEAEKTKVEIKEEDETKSEGAEGESTEDASAETPAESGEAAASENTTSESGEASSEEGATEASAESSDSSEEKKEDSDG